jgi:glycosyltransferase involved in cell wall biosynthesis
MSKPWGIRRWLSPKPSTSVKELGNDRPSICRVNNPDILVSVIITYYAKESTIFSVLESIHSQSLHSCAPNQIEIIIIDDGTEGETVQQRLPPNVTYLWQRKPGDAGFGASRARNTGAKIANGKYLLFLDADILTGKTYVEAALRGFQKYGNRILQCGYIWDYFFAGCPDPRTQFGVWENPDHLTKRFFQVASGSMALSRDLFVESKGFDEEMIYGEVEDTLFGYQLSRLRRTAVYFNREMECRHVPHPPSIAHAEPDKSWHIVKTKYPDFYEQYIVQGLR